MDTDNRTVYARTLRGYFIGQALIVAGAAGMEYTGSFIPLALGGSAALMLTYPLVRLLVTRKRRPAQGK